MHITMRALLVALALALVLAVHASPALAQTEVPALLSPRLGALAPRADYRSAYVDDRPVHGRGGDLGATRHDLSLLVPVAQSETDEWSVTLRTRVDQVDTDVRLPDTGEPFPDDLWDLRAGLTYRHRTARGWITAASATVGSASDEPFASLDETTASATALLRVPHGPTNAWVGGVTWSTNRAFLNYVPLPILGYWYEPRPDLLVFAGLPFLVLRVTPVARLTFLATYFPPERGGAQVRYDLLPRRLAVYGLFETDEVRYLRADRERRDDALTFLERRAAGGVRLAFGRRGSLDLQAGYAFDGIVYEGEDFDDRHRNRLNLGDGPYGAARLGVSF